MAETLKSAGTGRMDEVSGRMSDVAHDVVERFQENRPLMYAGIGVLVFAAGLGIWALIRQFGGSDFQTDEMSSYRGRSY